MRRNEWKGSQGESITGGSASSVFRAVVRCAALSPLSHFYGEEGSLIRVLESRVTRTKRELNVRGNDLKGISSLFLYSSLINAVIRTRTSEQNAPGEWGQAPVVITGSQVSQGKKKFLR